MFSSYAPKQQEVQFLLTGAIYERERAPNAPTPANQDIIGRRAVKMKEWLQRRAGRQMDRDSIRKWIAGTAKNQNLLPEDVLKMYARKRRDLSSNELQALLDMPVRTLSSFFPPLLFLPIHFWPQPLGFPNHLLLTFVLLCQSRFSLPPTGLKRAFHQ